MTNLEIKISDLKKEFIQLKSLHDFPRLYIISHFSDLRNEANQAFARLENTSKPENIKLRDSNWTRITEKINEYKTECLDKLGETKPFAHLVSQQEINSLEKKLFATINSNDPNQIESLRLTMQEMILKLEQIIFLNKTMIFLDRAKFKHSFIYRKLDPQITAGKLLVINDDFLGKILLQQKTKKLTSHYFKFNLYLDLLRANLNEKQINEVTKEQILKLNEVDMSFNGYSLIEENLFANFSQLISVNLSNNCLESLDVNIFLNLVELEAIDLALNKLKSISKHLFKNNKKLKVVSLSNNMLTSIDAELFSGLKEITDISLANNRLKSIDKSSFKDLNNLISVDLSFNCLESMHNNLFDGLTKLETISLNNNRLKTLYVALFEGLPSLITVNLANNQLRFITKKYFTNIPIIW